MVNMSIPIRNTIKRNHKSGNVNQSITMKLKPMGLILAIKRKPKSFVNLLHHYNIEVDIISGTDIMDLSVMEILYDVACPNSQI